MNENAELLQQRGIDAPYQIRKWYSQIEESIANEFGIKADGAPLRKFVVAAAILNPYAGTYSAELDEIVAASNLLGEEFGRRAVALAQGLQIESYGKACIVGTSGEYEHGNAFLTSYFADPIRRAIGGAKSWIPSYWEKRDAWRLYRCTTCAQGCAFCSITLRHRFSRIWRRTIT